MARCLRTTQGEGFSRGTIIENVVHSAPVANVSDLAATLSHELGNPLMVVMGLLDILKDNRDNVGFWDVMNGELDRLKFIVRELQTLSHVGDSPVVPHSVRSLLIHTTSVLAYSYPPITIQQSCLSPLVYANRKVVQQALLRILQSATKCTSDVESVLIYVQSDSVEKRDAHNHLVLGYESQVEDGRNRDRAMNEFPHQDVSLQMEFEGENPFCGQLEIDFEMLMARLMIHLCGGHTSVRVRSTGCTVKLRLPGAPGITPSGFVVNSCEPA